MQEEVFSGSPRKIADPIGRYFLFGLSSSLFLLEQARDDMTLRFKPCAGILEQNGKSTHNNPSLPPDFFF